MSVKSDRTESRLPGSLTSLSCVLVWKKNRCAEGSTSGVCSGVWFVRACARACRCTRIQIQYVCVTA